MSTLPLSGVNSRFFSAIPLSRFSLKMSRFFAYFELEKIRSAQHQVELRRLINQLPECSAKLIILPCKIVKVCVFCLFILLTSLYRQSLHRYHACGFRSGVTLPELLIMWSSDMPPGTDCPYPIRILAFFEMIRPYHVVIRI